MPISCQVCGASHAPGDRFCAGCGQPAGAALPGATTPAEPVLSGSSGWVIASMGRRIVAAIIDFIVCWSLIALLVMVIPRQLLEDGFARKSPAVLIPIGLCCLALVYYVFCEALSGATLGKAIVGVQVRRRDGDPCNLYGALLRNLFRPIDAIAAYLVGCIVALLSSSRQRIGDLVAGTIVVAHMPRTATRILLVLTWIVLASGTFVACEVLPRR